MDRAMMTKGGGMGDRKAKIDAALDNLRAMIDGEDMHAIDSRKAPPMSEGEPREMECEACKDGSCTDPEHNEEDVTAMLAGMGGD